MNISQIMKSPRLKVKRAQCHIDTLIKHSAELPEELYEFTNGPIRSKALLAKADGYAVVYRPKEPIAEHFGAIMGDIVNNLREAMDYWMNNAILCVSTARRVHFPFSRERKDLETSPHYPAIKKTFPQAALFISKEIEPCRDTNLMLWAVTSLCNGNKHNDFIPVVSITTASIGRANAGGVSVGKITTRKDADRPQKFIFSDSPITINEYLKPSVEIKFPKGAVFEDQPVIPTIANMTQVVSETLDALETFIRPYCK